MSRRSTMRSHLTPRRGSAPIVERRLEGEPVSRIIGIREFYGRSLPHRCEHARPAPRHRDADRGSARPSRTARRRSASSTSARGAAASSSPCWRSCRRRAASASMSAWGRLSWRGPMPRSLVSGTVRPSSLLTGSRPSRAVSTWWWPTRPICRRPTWPRSPQRCAITIPAPALDGGPDGLSAYRRIVPGLRKALRPGGFALFEIGPDQAQAVAAPPCRGGP